MSRRLVQLLLPIHHQDGSPVAAEEFARVRIELTEQFGGVTAYSRSPATGLWKRTDVEVERDQVIMVEVVVDEFDPRWWQKYRQELERRFGQDEIHARALAMELI
ncbi:MAG TPA: hypothetical protein VFO31_04590 [Vicinamibacterales bacterium]|nr:hypothetical protein [Vicinamibacterales bacterium]